MAKFVALRKGQPFIGTIVKRSSSRWIAQKEQIVASEPSQLLKTFFTVWPASCAGSAVHPRATELLPPTEQLGGGVNCGLEVLYASIYLA